MTILAIDLGTSAIKFLRADADLAITAIDRVPSPGLDVDHWLAALRQTLADHGDGDRIEALAITGQMHGLLPLEEDGPGEAIPWTDQRAADIAAILNDELGSEVAAIGGPIASGFLAASLAWIRDNEPARWQRIRQVMLPKDALIHALTGRHVTDPTDAAGSGLLDIPSRRWHRPLIERIGVPDDWLPRIVPSGSDVGPILPRIASHLGLSLDTRIVIAGGDAAVGAFGARITASGEGLVLLSSGAQIILPSQTAKPDRTGRWYTWPSVGGQAPCLRIGTLLNAGIAVDWTGRVLGRTRVCPDKPAPLIVLPHLIGERTPVNDAGRHGVILGITPETRSSDIYQATLEGVAYGLRHAFDIISEDDARPAIIRVGGGGTSIEGWPSIIANVLGIPVQPVVDRELSALGAAALAADRPSPVTLDAPVPPDPALMDQYETRYRLYRAAVDATAPLSSRLAALSRTTSP